MVKLMDKKVLVRMDQAKMTKGKYMVVSDELRSQMIKPHNPEIGVWEENMLQVTYLAKDEGEDQQGHGKPEAC
jgi:hypothetical protein